MSTVTRPRFAEGQILAAQQLEQLASIPRGRAERHNRLVHRWGIVSGLNLTTEEAEDGNANPYVRVFVEPGLALDGYGREILVAERTELNASKLQLTVGNNPVEGTSYPVFIVSQYVAVTGGEGIGDTCGGSGSSSDVEEDFEIHFGSPGDETQEQVAPDLSADPAEDEGSSDWFVLLGFVTWDTTAQNFAGLDEELASAHRPFVGINASAIAGDDSIVQLQPKADLLAGDTVLQVSQTSEGPELCFGTFAGEGQPIEPLLKVSAEGDVTVKGEVTDKRSGNTLLIESGIASDGIVLPLPEGVTEQQVADGEAVVHVQVSALIDPSFSPDPTADFAALIQECRVDEDRRVHCRIAWASLPMGGAGSFGDTLVSGPGSVRYAVSASTTEGGE